MKIKVPDYFTEFTCTADKCSDSCCIGWEIDIDDEAREKYSHLERDIGREIAEKTQHGYFPLYNNGRCAFLDDNGLCRIISTLGNGYLCNICREHPRYYGVGQYGIEGGLGLGCEEAARITLSLKKLPKIIEIERAAPYSDEDEFAEISACYRERLFEGIFHLDINELAGLYMAYASLADAAAFNASCGSKYDTSSTVTQLPAEDGEIKELFLSTLTLIDECEALNENWRTITSEARRISIEEVKTNLDGTRGILYYFTHRYVREGVEDMSLGQRILFSLASSLVIASLMSVIERDGASVSAAVAYSKNIEYSTENVDIILDGLSRFL